MAGLTLGLSAVLAPAAAWKVADAPLLTPWVEKVEPQNLLAESPCLVIERLEWLNLNSVRFLL